MSSPAHLFIQPLLDCGDACAGYFVEASPKTAQIDPTALFTSPELVHFDPAHPWFIPAELLLAGGIPADRRFVPLFEAALPANAPLDDLAATLRGRQQARGLIAAPDRPLPGPGEWTHLCISAPLARTLPQHALAAQTRHCHIVVSEVLSHHDRAWILAHACPLSTSEYLLTFASALRKPDTSRLRLLELLALLARDADTAVLEKVFRQEAKLSYGLLRLCNSAAIAPTVPITGLAQAISLLGRRQLQRWIQLLVYADPDDGQAPTPLLHKAALRGRLMELLTPQLPADERTDAPPDSAFMIGAFSLLDVLLDMPMHKILHRLPLHQAVRAALLQREGRLGRLLDAVDAIDRHDFDSARGRLAELSIDGATLLSAQLQALAWAARLRNPE